MLIQGQPGPIATIASLAPGVPQPLRQGNMGDAIMSELHGRYYEACYRKSLFATATQAALATTAAFATTYTGLCLSNPIGSPVNLVLTKVGLAQIVAQTSGLAWGIMTGFNSGTNVTHTTPQAPSNNFINGPSGYGLTDISSTLPTAPILRKILGYLGTGATTVDMAMGDMFDLEGSISLPAGAYACIYTSAASVAASLLASMEWEEVPS